MNLLCSNVVRAPDDWSGEDFATLQLSHMRRSATSTPTGPPRASRRGWS